MVKLGIIGAMSVEVEMLKQNMTDVEVAERCSMSFYEGMLEGVPAVVVECGVGKVNAALCVQILCDLYQVTHLVNTGVAGSLDPRQDIGDLVVSTDAMYHDFDCHPINPNYAVGQVPGLPVRAFPADRELSELAIQAAEKASAGQVFRGRIASGDQFICDQKVKDTIVQNTQALCAEMEGAAIAHAAWRNGLPFVVIRAISDKADNSAQMDYPTFEAMAAKICAQVVLTLAEKLAK